MTALITPMRDGAVDLDALGRLVEWQIASGVAGLVARSTRRGARVRAPAGPNTSRAPTCTSTPRHMT
jgi:hypothetical protein